MADEDGNHNDWVELFNAGNVPVDLFNYSLTDNLGEPQQWVFPHRLLQPGEFLVVHCSEKNRFERSAFTSTLYQESFTPQAGINNHVFSEPFQWDGISNIVINVCAYAVNYSENSIFNQTSTDYVSCIGAFADNSDAACFANTGNTFFTRPNIRLNGAWIGDDTEQNCNTCYPAPYGNWYWSSRHQILLRASELLEAGLSAGNIDSLAFDVVTADPANYQYISFAMSSVGINELTTDFLASSGAQFHTNFKISGDGEAIYLFSPDGALESSLFVNAADLNLSVGSFPDGSNAVVSFVQSTGGYTNEGGEPFTEFAVPPILSVPSGFYTSPQYVSIYDPNVPSAQIHFTTDGSDPTLDSPVYTGEPIFLFQSTVVRARAFAEGKAPSGIVNSTLLYNISHTTPILSLTVNPSSLYGPEGIFDNIYSDIEKASFVEYFDSTALHGLVFSKPSSIRMDGGAGGSRTQPQRSFRLDFADGVLGDTEVEERLIPNVNERNDYGRIYLRNGSNQFNVLPYKDAAQVEMMGAETYNYYMAWRPVTVYINGQYFGLYEMREKYDAEMFAEKDFADKDSIDLISISYYYGGVPRAVEGSLDGLFEAFEAMATLDPNAEDYWEQADQYFDMKYYTDYICAENFMCNIDWPYNNIKIYRSDATSGRWRFGLQDLELGLQPNGWTSCADDHIAFLFTQGGNAFVALWIQSMNNPRFRNYFINRYADLLNTSYSPERLQAIENSFFNQTVLEMPNQYQRWAEPWNVQGYMDFFYNNHLIFQSELACRSEQVRLHMQNGFQLPEQISLTLDVEPAGAGRIQINTITPAQLPWTGIYFNGNPVTITAIANPGYTFDHWTTENLDEFVLTDSSVFVNLLYNGAFVAHFNGEPVPRKVLISEVNYNSDEYNNPGDWLELYNQGETDVNLTGWTFQNEIHAPVYRFKDGLVLASGERLVLAQDTSLFRTIFPNVPSLEGPFLFGLSNNGGELIIRDHANADVAVMEFTDSLDWSVAASGTGLTLELREGETDLSDASSWFAGCVLGSPGEAYSPCNYAVVVSEINYNSAQNANVGDWVELRNVSENAVNISGWILRDADDDSFFQLPDNTILNAGEMVVIAANTSALQSAFPLLSGVLGNLNFGFSSNGDAIRLYDLAGKEQFAMHYQTDFPWALEPNGAGYTLEMVDSTGIFSLPENWFVGCLRGSPGDYFAPCNTTGIVDEEVFARAILYPNPVADKLFIQCMDPVNSKDQVRLMDLQGRSIEVSYKFSSENTIEVDVTDLASGVYVVSVGGSLVKAKFVKE